MLISVTLGTLFSLLHVILLYLCLSMVESGLCTFGLVSVCCFRTFCYFKQFRYDQEKYDKDWLIFNMHANFSLGLSLQPYLSNTSAINWASLVPQW